MIMRGGLGTLIPRSLYDRLWKGSLLAWSSLKRFSRPDYPVPDNTALHAKWVCHGRVMVWKAINNRIPSLTTNLLCRLLQNSCAGEVSFLISPWFPFMTNEGELKWSIYSSICYVYYGTHSYVPINPRPEDIIWSLSTSWKSETLRHAGNISNMTSNLKLHETVANSHDVAHPSYCETWLATWFITMIVV